MGLIWKNGATKTQKIISMILIIAFIGPGTLVFTHNFVAAEKLDKPALFLSLTLTLILVLAISYFFVKGIWRPAPVWHSYSRFKKALVKVSIPLFIFGITWINIAISLPQLYTVMFGERVVRNDVVVKHNASSRRSCGYRLKANSIDAVFFHYCITEDLYNRLPSGNIPAELITTSSPLGIIIEDIKLSIPK